MAAFEIVFDDEAGVPEAGSTVEIDGALWEVVRVDEGDGTPRVHLVNRSHAGIAAHHQLAPVSAPVTLAPPNSFESELVYTLNDLSSRLNTLAGALNAYWGTGARGAA
jgi:hypothetical protein